MTVDTYYDDANSMVGIVTRNKTKRNELLGKKIQRLAEQNEMSVKAVALLLGCSERFVRSLYNGTAYLSFWRFQNLAKSFGMDVNELLEVDETEVVHEQMSNLRV